ncbi:hypothetical protein [Geomicrobium sp. JCM 19039]|uniref:hypothetical protein n=1 Tax=Geomicrobium sp. JCM 19039 TaxID=1460636 RepID=UPI0005A76A80|nr:hypothetical protein [Geomicrobium sp. JCM 19039]
MKILTNPTAEDVLRQSQSADIFEYDSRVFSNVTDYDHIDLDTYEKGDFIGEIVQTTDNPSRFGELSATQLPEGTPIYETENTGSVQYFVIAEVAGRTLIYQALIEG